MAVIGSRANGTRVPQGGGFGPAQNSPQTAGFGAAAFQPASERRDVTYLGRPMLPTATGPAAGSGSASDNLADTGLPPLAPRSVLFVKSTVDRVRREWFDTVAQEERELDPVAATGFAGGIKQRFGDFTAKTLADMPDALRPHIAGGLERVGREIETRAADFEDVAGNVGGFNLTKQALDDISATVAHDRFAAPGLMAEGLKRIADAPLTGGAREILKTYYMGDLPVKTVLSHIDDDPDDALVALKAAGAGSARATGRRPDLAATQDPAGAKAPASDGLGDRGAGVAVASSSSAASAASGVTGSDGAGAEDGRFEPAVFYANIDQEVRGGLAAKAQVTSLRRRESARASTTKNLEQGIAANTVTPAQIEASNLEPDDKERLQAQLKDTRAREQSDAEAAERYLTNPQSFDPNNPQDRAMADQGFGVLAGETDDPASARGVGPDGEAIDVIDLATRFAARAGFMADAAIERMRHIAKNGSPEDSARAIMFLEEFNVPLTEGAVPPELAGETEAVVAPTSPSPSAEVQPDTPPPIPAEATETGPAEPKKDEETSAFGVLLDVLDVVTDFVPIVSEGKAALHAYELSIQLGDAMERGDEAAVRQLSADLALTMTDLLPGPNIAGAVRKIGNRADRISLIKTLKEKLQRLWNKAKGPDGRDAKPDIEDQNVGRDGSSQRDEGQISGGFPDPDEPPKASRRREISQAEKGELVINGIHKDDYLKRWSGELIKRDRNILKGSDLTEFDNNEALAKELGGTANVTFSNDPWAKEIDIVDDAFFLEAKGMASLGKTKKGKIKELFKGAKTSERRFIFHSPEFPIESNMKMLRRYSERYGVPIEVIYGKPGSLKNVRIPRLGDDL